MSQQLATAVYIGLIVAFFLLDRSRKARASTALWIPVLWLMINGSRPVSLWLQSGPTVGDEYLEGSPIDAAIFGILIIAGVIVLSGRWNQVQSFLAANLPILLFLAYCLISAFWSDYSFVAFKRWVKSVGDVVMILVVLTDRDPIAAVRGLLCRVGFVLIPISVLFIKYYPDIGRSYNPWTWIPMYCGVTTFKNMLGMITLVCAMGSLWCFVRAWRDHGASRRKQHLLTHGVILGMSVWIFWIADSMTSFSCFVLGGSTMVFSMQSWVARRKALVHLMVVAVITIALVALFFDSSGGLVGTVGRNSTLTGRTAIWNIVLQMAEARPLLGTGFESFWMGDRLLKVWEVEKGIQEAHNGYIEVYINLGWVGIAFLAALIVTGYRNVIMTFSRNRELGSIKLGLFTVGVIYSLTEAGFRMMSPVWLAFVLAIMAIPSAGLKKTTARQPRSLAKDDVAERRSLVTA